MRAIRKFGIGLIMLAAVGAVQVWAAPPVAGGDTSLAPYLSKLPAASGPESTQIIAALANPEMIAKLVQQYEAGGDVTKVEYAVRGIAVYVGRGGGEADRKMFAAAMGAELPKVKPATRGFLIRELQASGAAEASAAVGAYLLEADNSEYAAQALVAFGGDAAAEAVRTALPKAEGKMRATLAQTAGSLRDAKAVPTLKEFAAGTDRDVRLCAMTALGNIGDAGSADLLLKGTGVTSAFEAEVALDATVKLAVRCEEAKDAATADRIYKALWSMSGPENRHARCAGLQGLARVEGDKAMPLVAEAMASDDLQMRTVAMQAAGMMPGEKATQFWLGKLAAAPASGKPDILLLLAKRGDASALPAAQEQLKSTDAAVRVAAIAAVAAMGKDKALPSLLPLMAGSDAEKQAVIQAISTMSGGGASIETALPTAEPALKVALLGSLAQRGAKDQTPAVLACVKDADGKVRLAALTALETLGDETTLQVLLIAALRGSSDEERAAAEKSAVAVLKRSLDDDHRAAPVLEAMKAAAAGEDRAVLVRILGQIGGKPALEALMTMVSDKNPDVQEAAIRALANSTSPQAESVLLEMAKSAPKPTLQILALRGYIRLIGADGSQSAAQKAAGYKSAMALATRPDEKRLVLAGVAGVFSQDAFDLAAAALDDESVRNEAASAVVAIGQRLPGTPAMGAAAKKILTFAADNNIKRQANDLQRKAGKM